MEIALSHIPTRMNAVAYHERWGIVYILRGIKYEPKQKKGTGSLWGKWRLDEIDFPWNVAVIPHELDEKLWKDEGIPVSACEFYLEADVRRQEYDEGADRQPVVWVSCYLVLANAERPDDFFSF